VHEEMTLGRRNPIYIGNDNVFRTRGIKNSLTNEFINDATVELTLNDLDGNEISGQTWPLTLTYIAGTNGEYQGTIDDAIDVEDGQTGEAVLEISGDSLTATLTLAVVFSERSDPSLAWTSRSEIELMFGRESVSQWADLDSTQDADLISERIQWAVDHATDDARTRLTGSPVNLSKLTDAPLKLRLETTRLAGVILYESRGVVDTSDEEGRHRLKYHQDRANQFFQRVRAGLIRLTPQTTNAPGVITDTDTSTTCTDDDYFLVGTKECPWNI